MSPNTSIARQIVRRVTYGSYAGRHTMPSVIAPTSKHGGAPLAAWRKDVVPTVIAMAAEMGPDELTARAVAHRMGLQDAQIWRALPRGRSDILFLVAGKLQIRQTEAVAHHEGLRKRTVRGRVEAHPGSDARVRFPAEDHAVAPGLCGSVLVLDPRAVFQALGPGRGSA